MLGVQPTAFDDAAVMALTPEMKAWVAEKTGRSPSARVRLKALVQGLLDDGLLNLEYDDNLTLTAAQTFSNRRGNCLSFSLLFVALAREANLDVTFQMVDIPASFTAEGDIVKLNNHINVLVRRIRSDAQFHQNHVVDFNAAEYQGNYSTKRVEDGYALALYYSNLGVEKLQAGDLDAAFQYFRHGIVTDRGNPGIWTNLGALYSYRGHKEAAMLAYQQALRLAPSYRSALINLSQVLQELGRPDEAASYRERASYHQRQNPYYHFHLARLDVSASNFEQALSRLNRAIRLKADEHQFYHLRGLAFEKLGYRDSARANYLQAKNVVQRTELAAQYAQKLKLL